MSQSMLNRLAGWTLTAAGLVVGCGHANGQCTGQWLGGTGVPGISGTVYASVMWDPDGAGPLPPVLVVGGSFTLADSTAATNIAYWNGTAWSALGSGLGSATASGPVVEALAVYNGSLVAGGTFTNSGATTLGSIARWNGTSWETLSTGTTKDFGSGGVNALAIASNGDLIAGGGFTTAGNNSTVAPLTIAANRLARWNGAQWSALDPTAGTSISGSFSVTSSPARTLSRATGSFITDGFAVGTKVATSGFTTSTNNKASITISAVTATTLTFSSTGFGTAFVAETTNATITRLEIGANGAVNALAVTPGGDLIVAGAFTTVGTTTTPATTVNRIARWSGAAWSQLGSGLGSTVNALAVKSNGDIIAGGTFTSPPTQIAGRDATPAANYVIRWDVTAGSLGTGGWVAMDTGVGEAGGNDGTVRALAVTTSGDVIAAGDFWTVGPSPYTYVGELARWNGTAWSAIWSQADVRQVFSLLARPDGTVVVGGTFKSASGVGADGVAVWDGTNWSAVTSSAPSTSGIVSELDTLANGDVLVGGSFRSLEGTSASRVARLTGAMASAKSALGSGLFVDAAPFPSTVVNQNPPVAFATLPGGDIVCGSIDIATAAGGPGALLARWNGSTWLEFTPAISAQSVYGDPFPNLGVIKSLTVLPDGELMVGGLFFFPGDPFNFHFLARFDGTQWVDMGLVGGSVEKTIVKSDGHVVIAGDFTAAGGAIGADYIAEWDGTTLYGDGTPAWTPLGQGTDGPVNAIVLLSNGDLIAGGEFTHVGNVAAGDTTVNRVARWNGTAWSSLGSGMGDSVYALAAMPSGDIVAGGAFTTPPATIAGQPATPTVNRIARWNGTVWSGLGTGLGSAGFISNLNRPLGSVFALGVAPSGVLLVGGDFATAGGAPSAYLARWADCVGACCQTDGSCMTTAGSPTATCATGTLTVNGTCSPNVCPQPGGICCRGATCNTTVPAASCTGSGGIGAVYVTTAAVCNAGANTTTPCCYADFNKSGSLAVQDIFDFLNAWFAGSLYAKVGGDGVTGTLAVADIFDFLNAWFAGGC